MNVLECKRDEEFQPLDEETSKQYATELYAGIKCYIPYINFVFSPIFIFLFFKYIVTTAGGARVIGCDNDVFIRILSNINHVQFESINENVYRILLILYFLLMNNLLIFPPHLSVQRSFVNERH